MEVLNSGVKSVSIPDSLEEFGRDVFLGCSSLEDASNKGNGLIVTKDGVLCSGFASKGQVVIPDCVNTIKEYAFFGNDKITSLTITGNTKTIERAAFQQCSNLSSLYLGEGIENIQGAAFLYCNKLSEVVLPNSIKELGYCSFGECSNLKSVSYKDGLSINNAFLNTPWNQNKINSNKQNPSKPSGIVSGWKSVNGTWYYVNADGSNKTGWFYDPSYSAWFFMNNDGSMKTGWLYDYSYGSWFYLNGNGTMRTGWFYDNYYGKWYYLYSNGVMARNTYVGGYYLNNSGEWV